MAIVKMIRDERDALMTWHEIDYFTTDFKNNGTVSMRSFANGATYAEEVLARQNGEVSKDLSLNRLSFQVPKDIPLTIESIEKELLKNEYFEKGKNKPTRQIWDFEENKAKQV